MATIKIKGPDGYWKTMITQADLDLLIGQPDGVATLDANGQIPSTQIPALAITETYTVNSQAAMLLLQAQQGDVAIRTDTSQAFILWGVPASNINNWILLSSPGGGVTSVDGRVGVVTLADLYATFAQGAKADTAHSWGNHATAGYAASSHTHTTTDITDLGSYTGFDSRYYTETETNDLLGDKANAVHTHTKSQITDFSDADYATAAQGALADSAVQPSDNVSVLTNDAGYITGYTVTQGDVTQHEAALTITESQISDLGAYLTDAPSNGSEYVRKDGAWAVATGGDGTWGSITGTLSNQTDLQSALNGKANTSHTHVKADITDFSDADYATAAQGVLADSATQPGDNISTLTNDAGYITGYTETDPVFSASAAAGITNTDILNWDTAFGWGNHASAGYITGYTVTQNDVTQHQAALTITESQISDLGSYLETVTAADIDSTGATDGYVLTADGAGNVAWEAVAGGGASALDDLTDVVITTPATDEILKFNGTNWVNATNTGGSGIANVVEDTTPQLGGDLDINNFNIVDANGNEMLDFSATPSATEYLTIKNGVDSSSNIYLASHLDSTSDVCVQMGSQADMFYVDGNIGIHATSAIMDSSRNPLIQFNGLPNSPNSIFVENAGSGFNPKISVSSSIDQNISLQIVPAGNGTVDVTNLKLQGSYVDTGATKLSSTVGNVLIGKSVTLQDEVNSYSSLNIRPPASGGTASLICRNAANQFAFIVRHDATTNQNTLSTSTGTPLSIYGLQWPSADGTNGQVMTTDGAGNLSFTTVSGGGIGEAPNDGQEYVRKNEAWAVATGGGASALDDLTDVVITSPNFDQVLTFDGTNWVNANPQILGLTHIHEDTTPQLGGDLDVQNFGITTSTAGAVLLSASVRIDDAIGGAAASSLYIDAPAGVSKDANIYLNDSTGVGDTGFQINLDVDADKVSLINHTANALSIDGLNWPTADGTNGQVLTTNGSGVLSFTTVSGGGIGEAPNDGQEYVRKNEAWAVATAGGGSSTNWIHANNGADFTTAPVADSGAIAIGDDVIGKGWGTIAIGMLAMQTATSGGQNVAIGAQAMRNATSVGNNNIAIGPEALRYAANVMTNNVALGHLALAFQVNGTENTTFSNCSGVGYDTKVSNSDQVQLGNSATTTYAFGAVQDRSDERDKTDIVDATLGLDFINALRPVEFRWDYRDDYFDTVTDENGVTSLVPVTKDGSRKRTRMHQGVIAQEVKAVMDSMGVDFGGYQDHSVNGGDDVKTIGYQEFIPVLMKAIQELSAKCDSLQAQIDAMNP